MQGRKKTGWAGTCYSELVGAWSCRSSVDASNKISLFRPFAYVCEMERRELAGRCLRWHEGEGSLES